MTRAAAIEVLRRACTGLPASDAGVEALLTRVARHDLAVELRGLLAEAGALALLREAGHGQEVQR